MNGKLKNFKQLSSGVVVLAVVLVVMFAKSFFVVVDAGTVGVVSTFGKVSEEYFQPGFHFKNPFSKVIEMNTRTTSYTMSSTHAEGEVAGDDSIQALAKDGGIVWFDVTVLYKLQPESAPEIYSTLGLQYQENIIRPQIRSIIREVAAEYPVNELYSTRRDEVQMTILDIMKNGKIKVDKETGEEIIIANGIEDKGILIENVLIRKVNISEKLSSSIELKLAAEQEVQRLDFEIQKAKKEAEKQVESAKGQRDSQNIINQSLTPNYLYYLYISELKTREGTIYVPVDPNSGLPLFKGVE